MQVMYRIFYDLKQTVTNPLLTCAMWQIREIHYSEFWSVSNPCLLKSEDSS